MNGPASDVERTALLFRRLVSYLRQWVTDKGDEVPPCGDWGPEYDDWPRMTRAYSDLLDVCPAADLTPEVADDLLYALARDNEAEVLKDELVARPAHLVSLAQGALVTGEPDAGWQIADGLGDVRAADDGVVPLLERFVQDEDEYVSRRALLALARRESSVIEGWAVRAWSTTHEYQRIAALHVLADKDSPRLGEFLAEAFADGRVHLVSNAENIRRQKDLSGD